MSRIDVQSLNLSTGDKVLCRDLTFSLNFKESWGLLGKNGAGKTSLIHSIAGLREFNSGTIKLNDANIKELRRSELAREIGILFQNGLETLPSTVLETVMLGRHPHVQSLFKDDSDDIAIAQKALADFSLQEIQNRQINSLSGGEKQRVAIAMLTTQSPNMYLLDEPSNHLDIAYQMDILNILLRRLTEQNAGMLMATHDINLAARFCKKFILLFENGETLCGSSEDVLNQENLSRAYGCEIHKMEANGRRLFFPA
ncbi:MAG: ABC transporter ATP-binding protein [Pseudohongiellaceae bacterium]